MTDQPVIHVERQCDDSFAVYVGGDCDMEGDHDMIFSFGLIEGRRVQRIAAFKQAQSYAELLAKRIGGVVEIH